MLAARLAGRGASVKADGWRKRAKPLGLQPGGFMRFHLAMFESLRGKRVTVMGLGRFGGGVGAVRFLVNCGARVTVTDLATEEALADSLAQIKDLPLERLRLGGHDKADFRDADLIVASPAVSNDHSLLIAAEVAGTPVTTEIGLFWSQCRGQIVGVTGSVGKSTTSAMIHAVLKKSGRTAWLGGNIGGSLLPEVDRIGPDDWVVLELSSFQLERLTPLKPRPHVAVVTNFRANHLDRHVTLDAYRNAKQNLLRWQTGDDVAVLNVGDSDVAAWATQARTSWFGRAADDLALAARACRYPTSQTRDFGRPPPTVLAHSSDNAFLVHDGHSPGVIFLDLLVPGEHHRLNAAAAVATTVAIGVELDVATDALNSFAGLPHRLEVLGEFDSRLWVNDSKATTPESAIAALQAFDRPVRLIAGGADKGIDLSPLADEIVCRGAAVYLSGRTGPVVANLLAHRGHPAFTLCESFDDSVAAARRDSRSGDVILLSPGCASWGQFRDYRERGERFRRLARHTSTGSNRPAAHD